MLRYSTVADIEDAKRRATGNLEIRLSILKGNRRGYKQQVENYQAQLADAERAGVEVDVDRLRAVENLQQQIKGVERDIAKREKEIAEISDAYDADIERFKMLREAVELRRTLSAKQSKSGE
jgi:predicted  nucleic acid-binding Zn-ribbon protein